MREFLREMLPERLLPWVYVPLNAFPLTPSGKIDRRAVPAPEQKTDSGEDWVAPRTDLEEVLAGIFSEVLQVERVGIFDDFFELGGHSLLATRISSRLRESLHIWLPVRRIFEEPTIGGLARIMLEDENERGTIERHAKLLVQLSKATEDATPVSGAG